MSPTPPLSETVRINEIGAGLTRRLEPDAAARKTIAKALDLASLDAFVADLSLAPAPGPAQTGWRLTGRVTAEAVQTCGLTLEPLPVSIDERFSIDLVQATSMATDEIEVDIDIDDNAPDMIEDGKVDLGQYAVEQLALTLDPFPRKPGAEFVQPEEPREISPFAVLKSLRPQNNGEG